MIHFDCPACGAWFDVDDRFAGRSGRCKNCGERMTIPTQGAAARPRAVATAGTGAKVAGPRLTPLDAEPAPGARPSLPAGRPLNWLEAVNSQVALAPITADGMTALRRKPSPLDEPSIAGPYKLATAPSLPALEAARGRPAGAVTRGYRHGMGKIQKLFRWVNESAYVVSVPFLMLTLLGLVIGNHSLLVLGGTAVVLLNLGRIVAGVANLVVIPFRESPLQGLLFLIPPITFFYLYRNWMKVHRPVKRVVGPILTILLVGLAFVAEPWLRGKRKAEGSVAEQVDAGLRQASKEIRGKAHKLPVPNLDELGKLKAEATEAH
jgi:predicted Zn finger-like uncharacterized protein